MKNNQRIFYAVAGNYPDFIYQWGMDKEIDEITLQQINKVIVDNGYNEDIKVVSIESNMNCYEHCSHFNVCKHFIEVWRSFAHIERVDRTDCRTEVSRFLAPHCIEFNKKEIEE